MISLITCIPSFPASSSLPTKGLTKLAPALAARMAWFAENTRVTFVLMLFWLSFLVAFRPSWVIGILIAMFLPQVVMSCASFIIPWASSLSTSALTGPSVI